MIFDRKNILTIGLCISIGLNIALALLVFQDKLFLKSTPILQSTVSQEEERIKVVPVQEHELEVQSPDKTEKQVLIPEIRRNDPTNEGWMTKKWNGEYSNSDREFYSSNSENAFPANRAKFTQEQCPTLNPDTPFNSYVIFENDELSLRLPFNEKWGGDLFKLTPYDDGKSGIAFGPLSIFGEGWDGVGCPWVRYNGFEVNPKEELNTFISKIKNDSQAENIRLIEIPSVNDPAKKITVLEYDLDGFGSYSDLIFFGNENLYIFGGLISYPLDTLEDIVSTIELK